MLSVWVVAPCRLVDRFRRFGETSYLHHHDITNEDEDSMFLRNISIYLWVNAASQPGRTTSTSSWRQKNKPCLMWSLCRSWWLRGLRRKSVAAWLLGSLVRIPLGAWMFVSCVYMLCCPVQVEISATGWSLVQRSPTMCLIVCVITETPKAALCSKLRTTGKWMSEWMNVSIAAHFETHNENTEHDVQFNPGYCISQSTILWKCIYIYIERERERERAMAHS
jgi:hypothetical protein